VPPGTERRAALSLGEWAVLGVLVEAPRHGYDVGGELGPNSEIGQVWQLRRPLVYRAIERLAALGLVEARRVEPGTAGPHRTIYGPTRRGRAAIKRWLGEPVNHLRDIRSELLLKLTIGHRVGVDVGPLVRSQRAALAEQIERLRVPPEPGDAVGLWRHHAALAAERFLQDLGA
jgi:DNA-binding PadR family transcriptional regulator